MSRSDYSNDYDQWTLIRWRGAVQSAISGKRGQQFFKDLLAALDALPEKKLITDELEAEDGSVCAIGALGKARNIQMQGIDAEDSEGVADAFGIAPALAREVVYLNDEWLENDTPEARFIGIRAWVVRQIKPEAAS